MIHKKNDKLQQAKKLPLTPTAVRPLCEYFGICGGCDLQNLSYTEQLKLKSESARRLFANFGDVEIAEIVASPREYFYRNRVTLHHDGKKFGFYRGRTHDIVPIKKCVIANDIVNQKITGLDESVLKGPQLFEVREDDARIFLQVNSSQNKNLVETVLSFCHGKKSQRILELYCGAGNLTFPLAEICRKITAVDLDAKAIALAEHKRQELKNKKVNFVSGDVADFVFKMSQDLQNIDTIICDPPRAGLKSAVNSIGHLGADRIVYVSCNPESFIRDARILQNKNYLLKKLVPLDMFPQTSHMELVGLFQSMVKIPM